MNDWDRAVTAIAMYLSAKAEQAHELYLKSPDTDEGMAFYACHANAREASEAVLREFLGKGGKHDG